MRDPRRYSDLGFEIGPNVPLFKRKYKCHQDHDGLVIGFSPIEDWLRVRDGVELSTLSFFREQAMLTPNKKEPSLSVAARIAKGSSLVVYDVDQHEDKDETAKERTSRAVETIIRDLAAGDSNTCAYVEHEVYGAGAHVYAVLRFDPSIKSITHHALSVGLETGCHIDAFCAGVRRAIALPRSHRYASGFRRSINKSISLSCYADVEDTFDMMRANPMKAPVLRRESEEPLPYRYISDNDKEYSDDDGDDTRFGRCGRQAAMVRLAFESIKRGDDVAAYAARVESLDDGSRDIAAWKRRGSFESECASLYAWCMSKANFYSFIERSGDPDDRPTYDLYYDRDILDDDESELLDRVVDLILDNRLTERAQTKAKLAAWEVLSFALSKKKHLIDTKRRYVGHHSFLNSGVLLDIKTLNRIGASKGLSRVDVRNGVTVLEKLGMLGPAVIDPKTGRAYSYRGALRFAKHHSVLLPSESLSRMLGSVVLYLVEHPDRCSWEIDFPSADEKGNTPDIVEVKVLDNNILASRLLGLDVSVLGRIVRGGATRFDRLEIRDAYENLSSLSFEVAYPHTGAPYQPYPHTGAQYHTGTPYHTVYTGVPYHTVYTGVQYHILSIKSALCFPLTRIYNAFGEPGEGEIGKSVFRSTGPPGSRFFGKIV
jgi:hypothetical protein